MAVQATLSTAEIATIILGSGGVAALGTKLIDLLDARAVRVRTHRREKAASSLAMAEHLEIYAYGCAGTLYATWDVLENGAAGPMAGQIPAFPAYPAGVNWQAIDVEISHAASGLRNRVEVARGAIESSFNVSEAQGHFYAYLQGCSIGDRACSIAARLRDAAGIPPLDIDDYSWDFVTFLQGEKAKEKQRHEQIMKYFQPLGTSHPQPGAIASD